jgi:hypothetical protein
MLQPYGILHLAFSRPSQWILLGLQKNTRPSKRHFFILGKFLRGGSNASISGGSGSVKHIAF